MNRDLLIVFGRIGLLSFGGPAAQIALMHKELVEDRDWLTEEQYLRALSFCMLLPGPEAMQLATYAGWKRAGIPGGLMAGGLFVLPGALVIAVLALAYGRYSDLPVVQALFLGVKATVVIIVIAALLKISRRALAGRLQVAIAIGAFLALFVFAVPFPFVILLAALAGAVQSGDVQQGPAAPPAGVGTSLRVLIVGISIWMAPLAFVALIGHAFLTELGLFFATLAVVTFGGAYAVLTYMTQEVVVTFGWLTTAQMMDALGLAETTPGPLILVTQFVGMVAGLAKGGIGLALAAGALTLWMTFVPCFVWIFAGAPLIDWLAGRPRLRAALSGITAAVVGVIANLSLWFSLHIFFADVTPVSFGPVRSVWPDVSTLQPVVLAFAIFAAALLLWRKWSLPLTLLTTAALSLLVTQASAAI